MKAVVKYAPGPGNIDDLDVDELACGANQVKVEIAFCGVCGTDLHVLHDTFRTEVTRVRIGETVLLWAWSYRVALSQAARRRRGQDHRRGRGRR